MGDVLADATGERFGRDEELSDVDCERVDDVDTVIEEETVVETEMPLDTVGEPLVLMEVEVLGEDEDERVMEGDVLVDMELVGLSDVDNVPVEL